MPGVACPYSKGEINRAGEYLRGLIYDPPETPEDVLDFGKVDHNFEVVSSYRASFAYVLTKATVGVRSMVATEGAVVIVAQRLKRLPQILHKLHRMPSTNLARMEDIGGCRAVLVDLDEVRRVEKRLRKNWGAKIKRERDYIAQPKDTGYRGVHIVVERDDRRIEVQLRTTGQQQWAEAVERTAARLRMPLKDGEGAPEVLAYFRLAGEGIYRSETNAPYDEEFTAKFEESRKAVVAAGLFTR